MAVVGTNKAAVVAEAAAATVAAAAATSVVTDLAAVVMQTDSVTDTARTHCRMTSTGVITTQEEGSVLKETCPSPACVVIFACRSVCL